MRFKSCVKIKAVAFTAAALICLALLAGCGGGGGGGGGSTVTASGVVLRADTNQPIDTPGATVNIGGKSGTTGTNGSFVLPGVPANASSITVTAANFATLTQPLKLNVGANGVAPIGTLFLSATGYNATVTGRVVTTVKGAITPVGGATVTIAAVTVQSATDGTFTIPNLPVGLGSDVTAPIGTIQATGYTDKPIYGGGFALAPGVNALGDQSLGAPIGSTVPSAPYTITGLVLKGQSPQPGATVALSQQTANGPVILGTVTTDSTGAFFFWVVPGTYTLVVPAPTGPGTSQPVTLNSTSQPVTQNIQVP